MEAAPLRNQLMNASCSAPQKEIYFFLLAAPSAVFINLISPPGSLPQQTHFFSFD